MKYPTKCDHNQLASGLGRQRLPFHKQESTVAKQLGFGS